MLITQEENKFHSSFILDCVNRNIHLPTSIKFGTTANLSIQEIVHSNTSTLRQIGKSLEKVSRESGDSKFNVEGPAKINTIEITNWIDFLAIQIKINNFNEELQKNKQRMNQIKKELEGLLTPSELKEKLVKEMDELTGKTQVDTVKTLA